MLIASEKAPRPRKSGDAGSHVSRRDGSIQPMSGWTRIIAPPKPSRPSVTGWLPGTASPTTLTRHTPEQARRATLAVYQHISLGADLEAKYQATMKQIEL